MKKILIGLISAFCGYAQVNVPLTVREALYPGSMSGLARTNEPLTVGVPLPDSAGITSTSVLGLTGATAAQFSVEGTWPDGNIMWVKVRAIVPSVAAGGTAIINLTNSGSGNFGGPNLAVDNGATITVSTGTATFTVKKANFNIMDQAVVGTTTLVASGTSPGLVILGPNPSAAYPGNVTCLPTAGGSACSDVYSSANDPNSTAAIEENGPAMAVIKATGNHVDANGNVYMHFTARLYFYQNQNYVKVATILRNADYGHSNTFATAYKGFQGYELRIHPNLGGTLNYTIGNDTATPTAGTLNAAGGTDSAYIYQAESNLMTNNGNWCQSQGASCVPYTTLSGYSIVDDGTALLNGTASQFPAGWADVRNANGAGVEIGQYQFAAYGNKSLEFNAGGTDVRIGIWARENNTASTSSAAQNQPYYMPWPQWSINDVYLNFHATADATLSNDFLKLQHYLVAAAAPAYYNSCNVFFEPLLDPAEETNYYNNAVTASASPAITAPTISDLGTVDTYNWPLNAWRYYPWATGGVSNQMEFRLTHVQDFLRRGLTGGYLDSAHFYKMIAEKAFPMSDGFNWRTSPAGDTQYVGLPVAASANSTLAMTDWVEADEEHSHWYGMPDYYFLSGDETIHDGIIEGPKDSFLNSISSAGGTTDEFAGGWFWAARSVGVVLMSEARLYKFLQATGDPDAAGAVQNGQSVYNLQVQQNFCVAGDPSGCTPDPYNYNSGYGIGGKNQQRGTSRVRGVPYAWGDTIEQAGCPTYPTSVRDESAFMTGILLQGLWEFRQAIGPSWANYNQAFDLGYGISRWAFSEMYSDNGTNSWVGNGFRYKEALDFPNACNVGSGAAVADYYWMVQNPNAYWPIFYFRNQYEGGATAAALQRQFNQSLQNVISGGSAINAELFHYTIGEAIYAFDHPSGASLTTVPISGFTANGSSYTLTWNVPAGATSYRIKWGPLQIVDWIGFNSGTNTFIGNPATTMNWFAATDATGIPTPSGTTQSLTINTGVAGLSAANFMVKAYVGGSVQLPAPPFVSLTAPAAGATLSGVVTVSAAATAAAGVANVQFQLDGANLGNPVTGAGPAYSTSWNTTTASNASHVLSALVTDSAGNTALGTSISVTVNNVAATIISNVTAASITSSGTTITWTTSVQADSQVAYGPTAAYGSLSPLAAGLVVSHAVTLSGLSAAATYHFQVLSHNAQGTLVSSADSTFTTAASSSGGTTVTGTAIPSNTWTFIQANGWAAELLNYDKSVYVSSRKLHCIWGAYKQWLSSEHNNGLVCYSYSENNWHVLENNGYWHSSHGPEVGHTVSLFAYMPDRDTIAFQSDGSGSNQPESFVGLWWWYDVAGLSGQDKEFTPRPWVGVLTPLVEMLTYDTNDQKLIMYDQTGSIEVCDPNTNACVKPSISGTAPPTTLTSPNMVYNTSNNSMYIFGGGQTNMYTISCTANACTSMTGAQLAVTCTGAACVNGAPPARLAAGMAYSTADNVIMMVGGLNSYGGNNSAFNDTWIFNPTTLAWTQMSPPNNYADSAADFTADRLTYDQDSNTFILMAVNGYTPLIYAYPYSAALNYGRVSNTYTPPAGSMNRVSPVAGGQSWAFDPAIAASGAQVYMGWVETGANSDNSTCGETHHPYIQSGANGTTSYLPAVATQAAACVAIDPDLSGSTNDSKLRLGVVSGTLWEAHEKINTNQNFYSSAFAQQWTGNAWSGGAVGCFSAPCGANLRQNPQSLIGVGTIPTLATIEWNHATYTPEGYIYVSQWNGSTWGALGGKLNINGTGTQTLDAALATDGINPAACWTEQVVDGSRTNVTTTPQIQCAKWNGSGWARFGTQSLNRNATSWASDPSMTYVNGSFYVGWVERTTAGLNNLYVCQWSGSTCTLLGGGALNVTAGTSWAAHPSLATDGTNVYLAWEEQPAQGQHSMGYVKQWNGSSWTQIGGALNADPVNGSVEGISLTVAGAKPTAIWGELTFGSLRQAYSKQWSGTAWTAVSPPATTCDLNGDGTVNLADVQLAVNQAIGLNLCTTADLLQNGQCSVIDVQRVVDASLGGACLIQGH